MDNLECVLLNAIYLAKITIKKIQYVIDVATLVKHAQMAETTIVLNVLADINKT